TRQHRPARLSASGRHISRLMLLVAVRVKLQAAARATRGRTPLPTRQAGGHLYAESSFSPHRPSERLCRHTLIRASGHPNASDKPANTPQILPISRNRTSARVVIDPTTERALRPSGGVSLILLRLRGGLVHPFPPTGVKIVHTTPLGSNSVFTVPPSS